MLERRSHKIQIKPNHKYWEECDRICDLSKHLYNQTIFHLRQEFIHNKKILKYTELYHIISKTEAYQIQPNIHTANQIGKDVYEIFSSFLGAIRTSRKKNEKVTARLPKYKDRIKGRFQSIYTNQRINKYYKKDGFIKLSKVDIKLDLPKYLIEKEKFEIKEVVVVPTCHHYEIVINYVFEENEIKLDENKIASIDFGVNNLITLTNNIGKQPLIYSGKHIKSINQYFNKRTSELKSKLEQKQYDSKRISNFTRKRNNKINHEIHNITKSLVNYLHENEIGKLIIGNNADWKQNINIGKKNNQKFVYIPYSKIISQLKYKFNGEVILTEESYTSKSSFLDLDEIPTYNKNSKQKFSFSGKRIHRGLYKSKSGNLINADVNGSYNIMRKVVPNVFSDGIEGFRVNPLWQKFSKNGQFQIAI